MKKYQNPIENFKPPIDIYERSDGICINVELPGISEEDIDVRCDGRQVIVMGHKENSRQCERYHRIERATGFFYRLIDLPDTYMSENLEKKYLNGILEIFIAK